MLFKKSLLLLGALFVGTTLAAPIQDISATSIDLETSTDATNTDHLTVTVTRVDDLLSDDGEWLAERIMAVVMNFDVNDDQILLNDVPLPLGASSVQIQAAIIANADLLSITNTDDALALAASFDMGLVTVEVEATAEMIETADGIVRRIIVLERIVEIDGQSVVQTVAGQQIIDVYGDGTVTKYTGCGGAAQSEADEDFVECVDQSCYQRHSRTVAFRASIAAATGLMAAAFFAILFRVIVARRRGYVVVTVVDEDARLDSAFDDKYPVDAKVASPPSYEENAADEEKKPLVL